jgi:hypothetical protein
VSVAVSKSEAKTFEIAKDRRNWIAEVAVIARNRRNRKSRIYRGFTRIDEDQAVARNAKIPKIAEIERQNLETRRRRGKGGIRRDRGIAVTWQFLIRAYPRESAVKASVSPSDQ